MIYAVLYVAVLGLLGSIVLVLIAEPIALLFLPGVTVCALTVAWCLVILYVRRGDRRRREQLATAMRNLYPRGLF